ncbi:hypothetical protein MHU86_19009 [Fragilaria crotonensis]|nr:hypothetical protein MHU86_19009 [Fragilaria crotonensis]
MQLRKQSPKIRRRKKRSKVPVDPIAQELEDEALFYQSQLTPDEVSRQLEASTTRIQRATDRFLDVLENMRESNSFHAVDVLFGDQGHPVSNEIKDAIDDGFSTLHRCYNYCIQNPSASRLHLKPLGAQTKALLMAFLALPPLPSNYIQVVTFCGALAQYYGCHHLVSSSDHAVAHFYNLLRYLQVQQQPDDEDTLEALCEPTEILFRNHQVLLNELITPPAIAVQIEACLGTRMHKLLVNRTG